MSEVKVNKITPTANCGTVTLGDSGDTFSLPAGVTLSNAGSITNSGTITNTGTISGGTITGTIDNQVNWDTTAKTAGFTAVAGNGYFVNTTSGAITVTLPATPTSGDLVGIKDYANTADTNNITIDRNGSNIQGTANNFVISTEGLAITLIYVDGTQGWVSTGAAQASDIAEGPTFICATGGCISYCGDYKIHTFTGPGTFTVNSLGNPIGGPNTVDYLVVAGGGGGGGFYGGAGAGGYRESSGAASGCYSRSPLGACVSALPVSAQGYPITVGGGGAEGLTTPPGTVNGTSGSNSVFSTITSTGGGFGSGVPSGPAAGNGGSGGGEGYANAAGAGSGNTPPVSPPQGNPGGTGTPGAGGGGGGGGATAAGGNAAAPFGSYGPGGAGATTSISGTSTSYAGGGGGGSAPAPSASLNNGGLGGGGSAYGANTATGEDGTTNTGGGGAARGGTGGSGIIIIRYKYQ